MHKDFFNGCVYHDMHRCLSLKDKFTKVICLCLCGIVLCYEWVEEKNRTRSCDTTILCMTSLRKMKLYMLIIGFNHFHADVAV